MRIGGHHDLPEIGGIGKYLLVAGHAGIEADLAGGGSHFTGGFSIKTVPSASNNTAGKVVKYVIDKKKLKG